jgi:hypothetical protein
MLWYQAVSQLVVRGLIKPLLTRNAEKKKRGFKRRMWRRIR